MVPVATVQRALAVLERENQVRGLERDGERLLGVVE